MQVKGARVCQGQPLVWGYKQNTYRPIFLLKLNKKFRVIIREKIKIDGHYAHAIEIIYNFVGAIDLPNFDENVQEAI